MRCISRIANYAAIVLAASFFASAASAQVTPAATANGAIVIATGGAFQQLYAALGTPPATIRSLTIENNNTNGDSCWIYIGASGQTEANSILLLPGGAYTRYYPYIPSDKIWATCATTSDTLYADTQ